mgnify:CR=1 FL=1
MWPARIVHDLHGAMHVYDAAELAKHKAMGWRLDVPHETPKEVNRESTPSVVVEEKRPILTLPKKRGRPPKKR